MRTFRRALLPAAFGLVIASCVGPDLVVSEQSVVWTDAEKRATTRVENLGNREAGPFSVYVDGEEDPVSANHRPQVRHSIPGLAAGHSVELASDFPPLAHPDNQGLANVRRVRAIADPKRMIVELDEENNERTTALGPCLPLVSCLGVVGHLYAGGSAAGSGDQYQVVAQTFALGTGGRLCGIELALGRYDAADSAVLTLELFDGDSLLATATKPGLGIPLTSATVLPPLDPLVVGIGYFDLSPADVLLEAGHEYRFQVSHPHLGLFSVGLCDQAYPGGLASAGPPGSTIPLPASDLAFRISVQ